MENQDEYSEYRPEMDRIMKGLTIAFVAFALATGIEPMAGALPEKSVKWLTLAATGVMTYGVWNIIEGLTPLIDGIVKWRNGDLA